MQLLIWILLVLILLIWLFPAALVWKRLGAIYKNNFSDIVRERLFLSSASFLITFAFARAIAYTIHTGIGPFSSLFIRGKHIHHLVPGILIILSVGYCWLLRIGAGADNSSRWASRITSAIYGIGAALTLDEFALWLNLRDVYWERDGRPSIDAVILFGAILSVGLWGGRFYRGLISNAAKILKRLLFNRGAQNANHNEPVKTEKKAKQ